jgi:hypothetical protein
MPDSLQSCRRFVPPAVVIVVGSPADQILKVASGHLVGRLKLGRQTNLGGVTHPTSIFARRRPFA